MKDAVRQKNIIGYRHITAIETLYPDKLVLQQRRNMHDQLSVEMDDR